MQRTSRLVPGWVTAVLDFVEDPVSRDSMLSLLLRHKEIDVHAGLNLNDHVKLNKIPLVGLEKWRM